MVSATPVPTTFVGNKAVIKSLTNSTYVVVEGTHTFGDIEQHWAKGYIETLAAKPKQLVKGMTETAYRPNEQMTRAQFAVLLVRALALPHETYSEREASDMEASLYFTVETSTPSGRAAPPACISSSERTSWFEKTV